jgi:hypothetical protein
MFTPRCISGADTRGNNSNLVMPVSQAGSLAVRLRLWGTTCRFVEGALTARYDGAFRERRRCRDNQDEPLVFVGASLALIVIPGPDMIYVLTRGISGGRKVALVSAAGVCIGLCVHSVLAAVGLSAILWQSALAFTVVKYVGAAYLVYLGIRTLLSKKDFQLFG